MQTPASRSPARRAAATVIDQVVCRVLGSPARSTGAQAARCAPPGGLPAALPLAFALALGGPALAQDPGDLPPPADVGDPLLDLPPDDIDRAVEDAEERPGRRGLPADFPEVRGKEDFLAMTNEEQELFLRYNRPFLNFFSGVGFTYVSPGDFDDASGELSRLRINGEFGPAFRVSPKANFAIQFRTQVTYYNFEDTSGLLPPGSLAPEREAALAAGLTDEEPFDEVLSLDVRPVLDFKGDEWDYFVGVGANSNAESGAQFDESVTFGAFGGFTRHINDRLSLGLGVFINQDLDDDIFGIAFPIIDWSITEKVSLRTDTRLRGGGVAYRVSESIELAFIGGFEREQFRLDDDAVIENGIVTDTAVPLAVYATYRPNRQFIATGFVGLYAFSELDFDDSDGDDIVEREVDPSVFGGVQLSVRF